MLFNRNTGANTLLACLAVCGMPIATAAGPIQSQDAAIQQAIQQTVQAYGIPGMAVGLTVNGTQHFYSTGMAAKENARAVDADTLFEIGSISKTLTATLAAYAEAQGKLSFDASPAKYLVQLQGKPISQITVRDLATHTAGYFPLQFPDQVNTSAQVMTYFQEWKPKYPPGTYRSYANPSVGLLALLAAKSYGKPFAAAMEGDLLPALGLTSTFVHVPADQMQRYAWGYDKEGNAVRVSAGALSDEAYGVKSSARDMLHFVAAQLGQVPLPEPLVQALERTREGHFQLGEMTQDMIWEQYPASAPLSTLEKGNGYDVIYNSHAVQKIDPPLPPQHNVWVNKTGGTSGFGTYVAFVPAKHWGVVILANKNYPNEARVRLAHELFRLLE